MKALWGLENRNSLLCYSIIQHIPSDSIGCLCGDAACES